MIPNSKQKVDPFELIKKYLNLLWRKKIWIILITVTLSVIWAILFKFYIEKQREFTSTTVIKFDDPRRRSVGALTEFVDLGAHGNTAILNSSTFLNSVVDSLRLNLYIRTPNISRYELFKYINIDKDVVYGYYDIKVFEETVSLYYTNKKEEIENDLIQKLILSESDTISLNVPGLNFGIDRKVLLSKNDLELGLNPSRVVVDYLKGEITTELDRRTGTLLTISFTATHPKDAAYTLSLITDMYIEKSLEVKRFKTLSILNSFKEQLAAAQNQLEISERRLQRFRERNPYLFLSTSGGEFVQNLGEAQTSISQNNKDIRLLEKILSDINSSSGVKNDRLFLSLMDVFEEQNIPGIQQLVNQYNRILDEKSELIANGYSPESLQFEETENRLSGAKDNIRIKANNLLNRLRADNSEFESAMTVNQQRLSRLPQNETILAELQRDQLIKSQIYSNVLIKYNEAKISDSAVIPDALVLDEAEVPIDYGGSNFLMYLLGPILGCILSAVFFIGLDFLNTSIREPSDIADKIDFPVLATIPVILDEKDNLPDIKLGGELDPKLITSNYAPHIASEKFRLLRTKLSMEEARTKSLIITSLAPNEGKSLISSNLAITFAQLKFPTVLVDCDLRRGVIHNSFNCNKKPGISDILVKNDPITIKEISNIIQDTHVPNLFLISSGIPIPNPSELLGGLRMTQLVEILEKKFSRIIFDTPPVDIIPDALILNSIIHNFIMVVRYNKTKVNKFLDKLEEYSTVKNDLKGVIINGVQNVAKSDYHSYSYYHY